jgi:hypothetical protein
MPVKSVKDRSLLKEKYMPNLEEEYRQGYKSLPRIPGRIQLSSI